MNTEQVGIRLGGRQLMIETPAGGVIARAWRAGRWYEAPLLEHIRGLVLDQPVDVYFETPSTRKPFPLNVILVELSLAFGFERK